VTNGLLRRPVLLYDAECRFCRFCVRAIARVDRRERLGFLSLQDDETAALLGGLLASERLGSWRLVAIDGTLGGFGAGTVGLAGALGFTRVARLLDRIPDATLDGIYRAVARRRGFLGRLVPDGPAPRRFP
jgi:predicted DCC family thiol-disulfide oxidoreductase YuxK